MRRGPTPQCNKRFAPRAVGGYVGRGRVVPRSTAAESWRPSGQSPSPAGRRGLPRRSGRPHRRTTGSSFCQARRPRESRTTNHPAGPCASATNRVRRPTRTVAPPARTTTRNSSRRGGKCLVFLGGGIRRGIEKPERRATHTATMPARRNLDNRAAFQRGAREERAVYMLAHVGRPPLGEIKNPASVGRTTRSPTRSRCTTGMDTTVNPKGTTAKLRRAGGRTERGPVQSAAMHRAPPRFPWRIPRPKSSLDLAPRRARWCCRAAPSTTSHFGHRSTTSKSNRAPAGTPPRRRGSPRRARPSIEQHRPNRHRKALRSVTG